VGGHSSGSLFPSTTLPGKGQDGRRVWEIAYTVITENSKPRMKALVRHRWFLVVIMLSVH
jgi:hypothetical protein